MQSNNSTLNKYQQDKRYLKNNEYVSYSHFIYHI